MSVSGVRVTVKCVFRSFSVSKIHSLAIDGKTHIQNASVIAPLSSEIRSRPTAIAAAAVVLYQCSSSNISIEPNVSTIMTIVEPYTPRVQGPTDRAFLETELFLVI
jgi:hypothetical protein